MLNQLLFNLMMADEKPVVTGDVGSGLFYLVVAYGIVWLFIFGYLYSLNRRQGRLKQDIERLKREVDPGSNLTPEEVPPGPRGGRISGG